MVSAFFATLITHVMLAPSTNASSALKVQDLIMGNASPAGILYTTAAGALMLKSVMLATAILLNSTLTDFALVASLDGHHLRTSLSRIASAMILSMYSTETNARNAMT